MTGRRPAVSVIVPVHDLRSLLEETVRSVQAQTCPDWELLLVDDGSTDGSGDLCDRLQCEDARIRALHGPHAGVSHARNAGLDAAGGEWILFLDGDDLLETNALEACLRAAGSAAFAAFGYRDFPGGRDFPLTAAAARYASAEALCPALPAPALMQLLGSVWNKLIRREGLACRFDETMRRGEDTLFSIGLTAAADGIALLPETLIRYRRGRPSSLSATTWLDGFETGRRICRAILDRLPDCPGVRTAAACFFAVNACAYARGLAAQRQLPAPQRAGLLRLMLETTLPALPEVRDFRFPGGHPDADLWEMLLDGKAEEAVGG